MTLLSQEKRTYVAILSSYAYNDVQSTTLAKTIGDKITLRNPDIFVNIMYAGMESAPSYTSGRFTMQGAFATCKINDQLITPDVMIILGDEAWMMYRTMTLRGAWAKVPVILCGGRSEIPKDCAAFYSNKQLHDTLLIPIAQSKVGISVSGVIINEDPTSLLRIIKKLIPNTSNLHYISTNNYRDIYMLKKLKKSLDSEFSNIALNVLALNAKNRDSIENILNQAPENTPVITYNNYEKLRSTAPIFSLNQSVFTGNNVVASFTNPLEYVANAATELTMKKLAHPEDSTSEFVSLNTAVIQLNKEALLRFNLSAQAEQLGDNIVYHNIPEYYIIQHIRVIGGALLFIAIVILLISLYVRVHFYKKKIARLLENYRSLYNEYLTVYQNLPIGLMVYGIDGKLIGRNKESEYFTKNMQQTDPNFNVNNYNSVVKSQTSYYDIITKNNLNLNGEIESRLIMAYDRSDAEQEKQLKRSFFRNMIFAMEKSDLGIAQYDILSYKGFANRIWKKHLGLPNDNMGFANKLDNLHLEGREKIEAFYRKAIRGEAKTLMENLVVSYRAETHHIRYIIHILKYEPKNNNILAVEVILNIDEQVQKEEELLIAIHRAQESYRLKNAFISNMDEDINVFVSNIKTQINNLQLIKSQQLYSLISSNITKESAEFLSLLDKVIQLSKTESITTAD